MCRLGVFNTNPFKNSTECQNLCCGSVSPKAILIRPENFLNFRFNTFELRSIVNLGSYGNKDQTPVVLGYTVVTLLAEREDAALFYLSTMF